MARRLVLFLATLGVGALFFVLLISKLGWEEIAKELSSFSLSMALVVALLTAIFLLAGAFRWKQVLLSLGSPVSLSKLWGPYLAGFSLLFFVPVIPFASELFRAGVLQKQHRIPFSPSMASVVIDRILEITSNLSVIILGGLVFLAVGRPAFLSLKMAGIMVFVSLWFVFLFVLYARIFQRKSVLSLLWRNGSRAYEVEQEVFRFFRLRNAFFWRGLGASLLRSLAGYARAVAILFALGKGFAFLPGVAVLGFYYLGVLVPVPAALGSHDALQAVAFNTFGFGAGAGAAFALVIRSIEVVFALGGLWLLAQFGFSIAKTILLKHGS
ncbi:MAG TPA: lysylphosphatidylglycerol synthase transmembrane domain-containing protein [Candidatus Paceibacterota bacterium]|nr:lysylphosphatidylglycerol synthase transmembrane domain-containing protein [Candidatus Paceibacterota bacterium]